ncbi:MAG: 16S rRNA methyltransferase [Candidatus Lumbricidophila eiseniae]|uniref:16S rRNA methyltransferase n=1 Tax=Candidatus Lumbricidiphila eiseniae TaxID=1969409 RepID=A0A2A6FN93_9MICO|nr:MAG: 16S rRNA methyltransferase [Candidatus Lumbricidophila eiseniae]
MGTDHYFSAIPRSDAALRGIRVHLADRDVELVTSAGVFSSDRLDHGTRILLESVPPPPVTGNLLDLGCGWGPIALSLAMRSPDATVWAIDTNERALELTRRNAARLELANVRAARPEDVPDDIRFATIWSNPPIRVGKIELHGMLRRWLPRLLSHSGADAGADTVTTGSSAWFVVAKQLGADSLQRWLTEDLGLTVSRPRQNKGYRILRVVGPAVPCSSPSPTPSA